MYLRTVSASRLVKLQLMMVSLTALEFRLDCVHWIQFGAKPTPAAPP